MWSGWLVMVVAYATMAIKHWWLAHLVERGFESRPEICPYSAAFAVK